MDNDTMVAVTQADRDAASAFARDIGTLTRGEQAAMLNGHSDSSCYVQAFARHRHQSETGAALTRDGIDAAQFLPIETMLLWNVGVVTDWTNAAVSQKAEADDGEHYFAIDPEDGLEWEPTHWAPMPNSAAHQSGRTGAGEALREALRPFANAAKWWKAFDSQHRITTLHQHGDCLEVGHLRAALAALSQSTAGEDGLQAAYDAAVAFIESHVADPDITDEMTRMYAEYQRTRSALGSRP